MADNKTVLIDVKITGSFEKALKGLTELSNKAKEANKELLSLVDQMARLSNEERTLLRSLQQSTTQQQQLTQIERERNRITQQLERARARLAAAQGQEAAQLEVVNRQMREYNRFARNNAQANTSATGSLTQLRAQLALARQAYDNMSASLRNSSAGVQAERNIRNLTNEISRLEQATGRGQRGVGGFFGSIGTSLKSILGIGSIIGVVTSLVAKFKDFASESTEVAAKAEGIEAAFERLNKPDLLTELRQATKGTISDLNLMQQAVKFDSFKLPVDQLGKLLQFAQKKAIDTGDSIDFLTNSIVTGLARKSPMILDNLGISASVLSSRIKETGDFTSALISIVNEEISVVDESTSAMERKSIEAANLANKQRELGAAILPITETWEKFKNVFLSGISDIIIFFKDLYNNSVLFRDILGAIWSYVSAPFKLVAGALKAISELFGNITQGADGFGNGVESMYIKIKPYLLFIYELFEKIANVAKRFVTLDFKGAVDQIKNFKLPNIDAIRQRVSNETQPTTKAATAGATTAAKTSGGGGLTQEELKKQQDQTIKLLDIQKKYVEQSIKAEKDFQKDDIASKLNYQRRIFESNQAFEQQKLNLQLKYGAITKKEYDLQSSILEQQQKEFNNKQIQEYEINSQKAVEAIKKAIKATAQTEIQELSKAYQDLANNVDLSENLRTTNPKQYEKNLDLIKQLEFQHLLEVEAIKKTFSEKAFNDLVKQKEAEYKYDLDRFTNNTIKKLETEKKMYESIRDNGGDTPEINAQIQSVDIQLLEANAQKEIALNQYNADKKLEIERNLYQKKLDLYDKDSLEYAQAQADLLQVDQETTQKRIDKIIQYARYAKEAYDSISNFISEVEDANIQEKEQRTQEEQEKYKQQLDAGYITKTEYDNKIKESDKKLDAEKAKATRNKAVRDKVARTFEVITNTASAISAAVAASPLTLGMPFSAIIAGIGALQASLIAAAPLPKAKRGGLIRGKSHDYGGAVIEAEGGEAIINKRSTAMYAPILSAINEAGGGIPFAKPFSDGGYSMRTMEQQRNTMYEDRLAEKIGQKIADSNIYVSIEDINKGQQRYNEVNNISSVI